MKEQIILNQEQYNEGIKALKEEVERAFVENFGEDYREIAKEYIGVVVEGYEKMANARAKFNEAFDKIKLSNMIEQAVKDENKSVREYKIILVMDENCDSIADMSKKLIFSTTLLKNKKLRDAIEWKYEQVSKRRLEELLRHLDRISDDIEEEATKEKTLSMEEALEMMMKKQPSGNETTN